MPNRKVLPFVWNWVWNGSESTVTVEEVDEMQDINWTEITANLGISGHQFEDFVSTDNYISSEVSNKGNEINEFQEEIQRTQTSMI